MESHPTISFDNIKIAYASKSDGQLKKMHLMFGILNNNFLMRSGAAFTKVALKIRLPIKGIIRKTVFELFCGGETVEQCQPTVKMLGSYGVGAILDYSVEGATKEKGFDEAVDEIIRTIDMAAKEKHIPFAVFKVTGFASTPLLEKIQAKGQLSEEEMAAFRRVRDRVDRLCQAAYDKGVRIFVDAEETWMQDTIDMLCYEMMEKYNTKEAIVYNTYQMYRKDMLTNLKKAVEEARAKNYYVGAKLVRGAYIEKERERAAKLGYPDPMQPDKASTDRDYDAGLEFCIQNKDRVSLCAGSHNENSAKFLTKLMNEHGMASSDQRVFFAQLYGMSDNISFNLASAGYNVAKYVPYGPIEAVMPYLFRRAEENTSVAGQSSREYSLVSKEMARRKAN